jgi:hypothetical protein
MKRFHIHVSVDNLADGIRFYSSMFAAEPSVTKPDYAKWMLDDPRINFAISQRGRAAGVNHLGIQVDSGEELAAMKSQLEAADSRLLEQKNASCCYARSDKYWVMDPAGVAWETFHSMGEVPVYGDDVQSTAEDGAKGGACCVPAIAGERKAGKQSCCSSETV